MNRRVWASALAALLIGGGVGATVGTVTATPKSKTTTVVNVHKKKGKTRTVTQTVARTETVTETTTVTSGTTGGTTGKNYPDCPDQRDKANCGWKRLLDDHPAEAILIDRLLDIMIRKLPNLFINELEDRVVLFKFAR